MPSPDPASLFARATNDGADALDGLDALAALARWVSGREAELVARARGDGASWGVIAKQLGRTKQAVWNRYADIEEDR